MLEGVISKQWHAEQDTYWKTYHSCKSSKRWTTAHIKKLTGHVAALQSGSSQIQKQLPTDSGIQCIRTIYNRGPGSFPCKAAILLKHQLLDLLALPLAYKQQWIDTAIIAQKKQAKQQAGPYHSKRKYIENWVIFTTILLVHKGTTRLIHIIQQASEALFLHDDVKSNIG